MGKIIERGKRRRNRQRKKETTKPQFYGGSKINSDLIDARNDQQMTEGGERVGEGLDTLSGERRLSLSRNRDVRADVAGQRQQYAEQTDALMSDAKQRGDKYSGQSDTYGAGSDQSLADYRAGRGAITGDADKLENNDWMRNYNAGRRDILTGAGRLEEAGGRSADMLEGYAQNAAGEYTSAADKAFEASQNRTQKNALALAAGRGAGSIRTALATSAAGNQQAALDQQVVRAQEANQLNAMRNQAIADAGGLRTSSIAGAADIRTGLSAQDQQAAQIRAEQVAQAAQIRAGLGAQDQQAAQIQAARQEAARGAVEATAGQRAGLAESNIGVQRDMLGLVQGTNQADAAVGANLGAAQVGAGSDQRTSFLGSETNQQSAQLGANVQTEAGRAAAAAANSPSENFKKGTKIGTLGILG